MGERTCLAGVSTKEAPRRGPRLLGASRRGRIPVKSVASRLSKPSNTHANLHGQARRREAHLKQGSRSRLLFQLASHHCVTPKFCFCSVASLRGFRFQGAFRLLVLILITELPNQTSPFFLFCQNIVVFPCLFLSLVATSLNSFIIDTTSY